MIIVERIERISGCCLKCFVLFYMVIGVISTLHAQLYQDWRLLYQDSQGKIETVFDQQLDQGAKVF